MSMKCPHCKGLLKKVLVGTYGATKKALCFQCTKCDYYEFEDKSSKNVIRELKENPLKIKHKVVRISGGRLGMYFNKHIIKSLGLKKGEDVYVYVPDKNHILLEFK